jgi:predicted PolB exonuclease-like 3'-5' exonuclease
MRMPANNRDIDLDLAVARKRSKREMSDAEEIISEEALIETFSNRYPHLKERLLALSARFASRGGY